jgi:dTDP-glucose 4,6-dehydratase
MTGAMTGAMAGEVSRVRRTTGAASPARATTDEASPARATTDEASPARARERSFSHLLVCGGAGFIGSAFVRRLLARGDGTRITVLDKLTYAGNLANLDPVRADPHQAARFRFVRGDIADRATVWPLLAEADAVVNFAAESHVDRSILDSEAFLATGVLGVHVLLEGCRRELERRGRSIRYLQVSTDEVYGSVDAPVSEDAPLRPRSPYAAAKAAGDLLVASYAVTYGLDALVTRGANTYGPYQHPEKLIPLFVTNAIDGLPLPLYGDGLQRRDWLYVDDHAAAIEHVLRYGAPGAVYNVPGAGERANREIVARLLELLGAPWDLVRQVPDRPGHDRRYALDGRKLAALGWRPQVDLDEGLARTVAWYRGHEAWWRPLKSGEWEEYWRRQYAARLAAGRPFRAGDDAEDPPNGGPAGIAEDPPNGGPAGIAEERPAGRGGGLAEAAPNGVGGEPAEPTDGERSGFHGPAGDGPAGDGPAGDVPGAA